MRLTSEPKLRLLYYMATRSNPGPHRCARRNIILPTLIRHCAPRTPFLPALSVCIHYYASAWMPASVLCTYQTLQGLAQRSYLTIPVTYFCPPLPLSGPHSRATELSVTFQMCGF